MYLTLSGDKKTCLHLLLALDNDDICIIGALRMLLLCYTWSSRTGERNGKPVCYSTSSLLNFMGRSVMDPGRLQSLSKSDMKSEKPSAKFFCNVYPTC